MSFILDALRKSEHERQRSTLPGLSQVPLATPTAQLPRWALVLIGVLAAAVFVLGGAWWQSTRAPSELTASAPIVERSVDLPLPPAAAPQAQPQEFAPALPRTAEAVSPSRETGLAAAAAARSEAAERSFVDAEPTRATDRPALPSAAALVAEGIALPPLRLELHAFSEQPRDRFVFINGRKYVEGERLAEGPQLVSIEPTGAVLAQAGQRFLIVPK